MDIRIREVNSKYEPFLREMLFQAIFVLEGDPQPSREILSDPSIARYVDNWGRHGDYGLIAELAGNPIGAIWVRLFSDNDRGFGWINDKTPELSMAVDSVHRGIGVGTKLLEELLSNLSTKHRDISLSVSPKNPINHLYRRLGFIEVGKTGTSITMKRSNISVPESG